MIKWGKGQYSAYQAKRGGAPLQPKENKYKNIKVEHDGIIFDSIKEGNYYLNLKLMKQQGIIKDFERQIKFELQPGYMKDGKKVRAITYNADFKIINNDGSVEFIDTKGIRTEVFNIKKKMLEYQYPGITLKLI